MEDKILSELKSKLRITWDDEDPDLKKLIKEAESYLLSLTNATFDFEKEHWAKGLLLERCRYDYHNALDEFEKNFSSEIKRLITLTALGRVGGKGNDEENENVP